MARKGHIAKYSADTLANLKKREGSQSDWAQAEAMTAADIEAAVASDPDEADMEMDWENASVDLPLPKAVLNMRIDSDILDYFRKTGRGYQTRINAVLRSYVERGNAKRLARLGGSEPQLDNAPRRRAGHR